MMKRLLVLLALAGGVISHAYAQTYPGQFPANTVYGNSTGATAAPTPGQVIGAQITAGTIANSNLASGPVGTLKCVPGSTGGGSATPQDCTYPTTGLQNNVKAFGALGNSNGTHGNGNDDTTAFQNALNAANTGLGNTSTAEMFIPCGTYRITGTITETGAFPATYYIRGEGACSQIYLDTTVAATAFNFNFTSTCGAVGTCMFFKDVNFITPNTPAGSIAIAATKVQSNPTLDGVIIQGYGTGMTLNTSFAPIINRSLFFNIRGAALDCSADASCNLARITNNGFFSVGVTNSTPIILVSTGAGVNCSSAPEALGFIFMGNDVENGYAGPAFSGACSIKIEGNTIANNSNAAFSFPAGFNDQVSVRGNFILANGGGSPATTNIANVTGMSWDGNTLLNQKITFGAAVTATFGFNNLSGTSTGIPSTPTEGIAGVTQGQRSFAGATSGSVALAAPATSTGTITLPSGTLNLNQFSSASPGYVTLPGGTIMQWGSVNAIVAGTGVTFPLAFPTSVFTVTIGTANGSSVVATSAGSPTTSGFTAFSASGTVTANWVAFGH